MSPPIILGGLIMPDVKYLFYRGNTSGIDATPLRDGQVLFDQEAKKISLDAIVNGKLTRIDMLGDLTFTGTKAEWDALSDAEKAKYTFVNITDDFEDEIDVMQGATASENGNAGFAPQPLAGDQNKVLKGDGTWGAVYWNYNSGNETATFHI